MSTRAEAVWLPVGLGLLAALVYAGALSNGFTFDDPLIVVENPLVRGDGGIGAIFATHYWAGEVAKGDLYRPLTVTSYWINHRLGASAFGYHLVNILLHGLATVLVYLLFVRLAGTAASAAASILFATHPVHVEAVAGIVGRAELMATVFVLAAWLLRVRPWASVALFACGMFSKENAVVLPVLMLIQDLAEGKGFRLRRYVPYVLVVAGFLAVRMAILGPIVGTIEGPFVDTPAFERVLTAIYVLGRYVWLMLWPAVLSADYSYNQIPMVISMLDVRFMLGAATVAGCAVLTWLAVRRGGAWTPVAVGTGLFFVALLPVSNIFFGLGVMLAERLLYLPSIGFCLAAGGAIVAWLRGRRVERLVAASCLVALVPGLAYTVRAAVRTGDWFDQLTLFEATVKTSPDSALAHVNLGSIYQSLGRLDKAEASYRRSAEIAPDKPGPQFNLATVLEATGRFDKAIDAYRDAIRIDPADLRALNNLGRLLLSRRRVSEAIEVLEEATRLHPDAPRPAVNLAAAYLANGETDRSTRLLQQILTQHPDDADARRVLGQIPDLQSNDDE